jgi:hypothetical protein
MLLSEADAEQCKQIHQVSPITAFDLDSVRESV